MDEVKIRLYQPEDYEQCIEIFSKGIKGLTMSGMKIVFPFFFKMAFFLFLVVLGLAINSFWFYFIIMSYVAVCAILTPLLYVYIYLAFSGFVNHCINTDLSDIVEFYKGESCMFVAELNGSVIGMVGLAKKDYHKPGTPELQRMSVSSKARGKGTGKLLVKQVIKFCKDQSYDKVFLSTTTCQHAAIALYKKCGFKIVRKRKLPGFFISGNLHIIHFEMDL